MQTERLCPATHLNNYSSWSATLNLQNEKPGGVVLKPAAETFSRGLILVDWTTTCAGQPHEGDESSSAVTTFSISCSSQDCCDHSERTFLIPPGSVRTFVLPHSVESDQAEDMMSLLRELIHVDGLSESYVLQEKAQICVETDPAPFEVKCLVVAGKALLLKGPWFRDSAAEVPKAWRVDPASSSPDAWDWNRIDFDECSDLSDDRCAAMQKIQTVMQTVTPQMVQYAERMAEERFRGLTFRADFFIQLVSGTLSVLMLYS